MKRVAHAMGAFVLAMAPSTGSAGPLDDAVPAYRPVGATGPGTTVYTRGDTQISIGGQLRIAPTVEANLDFGIGDETDDRLWGTHINESGAHPGSSTVYIREEAQLNIAAGDRDATWGFYARLETDAVLSANQADDIDHNGAAGGPVSDEADIDLERVHGFYKFSDGLQLHAGADVWATDLEAAQLVHGDEGPGLWLAGTLAPRLTYSIAFLMPRAADQGESGLGSNLPSDGRYVTGGWMNYQLSDAHEFRIIELVDFMNAEQINNENRGNLIGTAGLPGVTSDGTINRTSIYWLGNFHQRIEALAQVALNVGSVRTSAPVIIHRDGATMVERDRFDVVAGAVALDIAVNANIAGVALKSAIGLLWGSGDRDGADGVLGGFVAGSGLQQFTRFGSGGTTIVGDHNPVLGTGLYGAFPEGWGNSLAGIHTGGLGNNFLGSTFLNTGRGDNPGLTLVNVRTSAQLSDSLSLESSLNNIFYNQDFLVASFADDSGNDNRASVGAGPPVVVKAGYVGSELANRLVWKLASSFSMVAEAQVFVPGAVLSRITRTLANQERAKTGVRAAVELIWFF